MSFVRSSKFRHVFGTAAKKDRCYDNIRITKSPHESSMSSVNGKFLAVVMESQGGGSFFVCPLDKPCRFDLNYHKVSGHQGAVLDLAFDPFNENRIASASEDCLVKIWVIPDGGLTKSLEKNDAIVELQEHQRKVVTLAWHPTASNILASACLEFVIVWDVEASTPMCNFPIGQACFSLSWNDDGSYLCSIFKDKKLRILDPRKNDIVKEATAHAGSKPQKAVYCGKYIFTTGFSRSSERQYALWDPTGDMTKPLTMEVVDSGTGVFIPFYDEGTRMVYIVGKGDTSIKYFEITDESPYVFFLSMFQSKIAQRGAACLPKKYVNFNDCEVMRFYRLVSNSGVEPVSMTVPRKSSMFQEDLYPDCFAGVPSLTASEWIAGENKERVMQKITKTGLGGTSGGGDSEQVLLAPSVSSLSKQSSVSSSASDPKPFERENSPLSLTASGDFDDSQYKKEIQALTAQVQSLKSDNQRLKSELKEKESVIANIKKLVN